MLEILRIFQIALADRFKNWPFRVCAMSKILVLRTVLLM